LFYYEIEYDKDADAAYIYFKHPVKSGQAKNTVGRYYLSKKGIIRDRFNLKK